MDVESIRKVARELEAELCELDEKLAELNPLQQKRNEIYAAVNQLRHVLGEPPYSRLGAGPTEPADPALEDPEAPIWRRARAILRKANRPMSVPEIADALVGLGLSHMSDATGKETLRTSMARKPNVFAHVSGGRVILRAGQFRYLVNPDLAESPNSQSEPGMTPPAKFALEDREAPLWERVRALLEKAGRPMSVEEIAAALDKLGRGEESAESSEQALLSSIARKPKIFAYVGGGNIALKKEGRNRKEMRPSASG